jgi:hypothetical protein
MTAPRKLYGVTLKPHVKPFAEPWLRTGKLGSDAPENNSIWERGRGTCDLNHKTQPGWKSYRSDCRRVAPRLGTSRMATKSNAGRYGEVG